MLLYKSSLKDSGLLVQRQFVLLFLGVIVFGMELLIESLDSTESKVLFVLTELKVKVTPKYLGIFNWACLAYKISNKFYNKNLAKLKLCKFIEIILFIL